MVLKDLIKIRGYKGAAGFLEALKGTEKPPKSTPGSRIYYKAAALPGHMKRQGQAQFSGWPSEPKETHCEGCLQNTYMFFFAVFEWDLDVQQTSCL